ncbi:hypothetical protein C8J57DRAFT_1244084 [Mycena rebaudengoi]|nr:hypothetical protein C8J57DRAFT_1244084 [Mycena rebaudengoi]
MAATRRASPSTNAPPPPLQAAFVNELATFNGVSGCGGAFAHAFEKGNTLAFFAANLDNKNIPVPCMPVLPLYVNECDVSQIVFSTYTGTAYATLKQTYNKYDPSRFNVRHTVGPIGL